MDREIEILSVWNMYSSWFFFQTKCEICYWTQGSTLVQGTTNEDVFDPTDIRNELLLSDHVFKLICIKLEASLLWDVDLLAAREPGSLLRASITCSLFCSLVWMDMTAWPMWTLVSLCSGASQRHHIYLFGAYQPQHRTTSSGLGWHRKGGVSRLGTNTGSLQDLRELLIWHHMVTKWKFVNFCLLLPQVKDADLSIKNTSTEVKPWVWPVVLFWCCLCSWVLLHRYVMVYMWELE